MEAGEQFEIVDWGYRALDSMRLEKAYRLWGVDMSADWTPPEAGMDRFVALETSGSQREKGDFIGRDALVRQRERGIDWSLACLVVDADDADPHGYEPVLGDGEMIGYVAAGGYGHVVEKTIVLAYLPVAYCEPGQELAVKILGQDRPARVVEQPLYDPSNERLLA